MITQAHFAKKHKIYRSTTYQVGRKFTPETKVRCQCGWTDILKECTIRTYQNASGKVLQEDHCCPACDAILTDYTAYCKPDLAMALKRAKVERKYDIVLAILSIMEYLQ
jgi:hypothetical protein